MSSISCCEGSTKASVSASALRMTMNCMSLSLSDVVAAVELANVAGAVHAVVGVELHELRGDRHSRVLARHFDDGVAAKDFLGLGERAIDDDDRASLAVDALSRARALQAAG